MRWALARYPASDCAAVGAVHPASDCAALDAASGWHAVDLRIDCAAVDPANDCPAVGVADPASDSTAVDAATSGSSGTLCVGDLTDSLHISLITSHTRT